MEAQVKHGLETLSRIDKTLLGHVDMILGDWSEPTPVEEPEERKRRRPKHAFSVKYDGHYEARRLYVTQPCELCGSVRDIHRHHRDCDPNNNARSNIGFLCRSHHMRHHQIIRAASRFKARIAAGGKVRVRGGGCA